MGRILAIDYGRKRCGIAVTDPEAIIASPLETIATHLLGNFIADYCARNTVDEFVVGYPRKLNNEPSEAVKYIDPFIARLKKLFPEKKIHLVDERFSSKSAFDAMVQGGVKKSRRRDKAMIDRISASIILQTFLNGKTK